MYHYCYFCNSIMVRNYLYFKKSPLECKQCNLFYHPDINEYNITIDSQLIWNIEESNYITATRFSRNLEIKVNTLTCLYKELKDFDVQLSFEFHLLPNDTMQSLLTKINQSLPYS